MILQPEQVWLAIEPVDMRLGIDGLSLLVQEALGKAPCDIVTFTVMAALMPFATNAATASNYCCGTARASGSVHAAYIAAASSGRTQATSFAP